MNRVGLPGAIALVVLGFSVNAHAVIPFVPTSISALTSGMADSLIQTVAIGGDYRDYMPATSLGMTLGLDIGINLVAFGPPSDFQTAFSTVTGQTLPSLIPFPRLSIHKGLPQGIDLGFSYFGYTDPAGQYSINSYGGSVKWAFIPGGVASPTVAAKISANYNGFGFINTHTYKLDVIASKNLYIIDPYVGMGLEMWNGSLDFPVSVGPLPINVSGTSSGTNPHFYGGLVLKLLVLKLTGEMDYSTAGVTTYGGKVSLGF